MTTEQNKRHPSFHVVYKHVPHCGQSFHFTGFMDDFGTLVKLDFEKLAVFVSLDRVTE